MPPCEQQLREHVIRAGRMMYERGWIAANDGNITARIDPERILATPAGVCKGTMLPEDLIVCDNAGNRISVHGGTKVKFTTAARWWITFSTPAGTACPINAPALTPLPASWRMHHLERRSRSRFGKGQKPYFSLRNRKASCPPSMTTVISRRMTSTSIAPLHLIRPPE